MIRVDLSSNHIHHTEDNTMTFEHGESWHSDGDGFLHIRDANKAHIAILAPGTWLFAATVTTKA